MLQRQTHGETIRLWDWDYYIKYSVTLTCHHLPLCLGVSVLAKKSLNWDKEYTPFIRLKKVNSSSNLCLALALLMLLQLGGNSTRLCHVLNQLLLRLEIPGDPWVVD